LANITTPFQGTDGATRANFNLKIVDINAHGNDTTAHMTADQKTALAAAVPNTRKVNGKALSADITLTPTDMGLGNVSNIADVNKSVLYAATAGNASYSTGSVALTTAALRNGLTLTAAPTSFLGVGVSADVIS